MKLYTSPGSRVLGLHTAAAERAGAVQLLEASEVTEVARSQDSPQLEHC